MDIEFWEYLPLRDLWEYGGKYYGKFSVTQINYHDHTIRVVDPQQKKGNCWISSPLHFSVYDIQYGSLYSLPYQWRADYPSSPSQLTFYTIFSMKCEQEVSDENYIPIIPCNTTTTTGYYSSFSLSSSSPIYSYAVSGEYVRMGDIPYSCTIGTYMIIQPLNPLSKPRNLSMSDLLDYLLPGLQLSFLDYFCERHCGMKGQFCGYKKWNAFQCYKSWQNPITITSDKTWLWKFIVNDLLPPFIKGLLSLNTLTFQGLRKELGNYDLYYPYNYSVLGGWIMRIIGSEEDICGIPHSLRPTQQ